MQEWLIAAGEIIVAVLLVRSSIRSTAQSEGNTAEWRRSVTDRLDKQERWHGDHFKHASDKDSHWTPREREDLSKRMDKQDNKLDQIHNDIKDLTQRMYGK